MSGSKRSQNKAATEDVSLTELTKILRIGASQVIRLSNKGGFPSPKKSKHQRGMFWRRSEVLEWVELHMSDARKDAQP